MRMCITLLAFVLVSSCGSKNSMPKEILKQDKMQGILWDVLRADAFAFQFVTKDSTQKPEAAVAALQQQVFAAHKTTREQFYKSYAYYKANPERMSILLDSMINKFTREKNERTRSVEPAVTDTVKVKQHEQSL
jgi:hypothetical protein